MMFQRQPDRLLTVIPATADNAGFCACLLEQNKDALHVMVTSSADWRKLRNTYQEKFTAYNPDEADFLICMGAMAAADLERKYFFQEESVEMTEFRKSACSDRF